MKTHSHLIVLGIFTLALILGVGQAREAQAQGPSPQAVLGTTFTYQGQLNKSGAPVNDTCSFTFSLWDSPSNATGQVGTNQIVNPVTVTKGLFTVVLNSGNQFGASAFTGQARWLQTAVKCTGDSSPVTLSRQQLTAAPYALFASAPWVTSGNNLYYNLGNVGIGITSPSAALSVVTGGAVQPSVLGLPTGVKVGTAGGTIPLAIRQNADESATPALAFFETASGNLGSLAAEPSTLVLGAASTKGLVLKVNDSTTAMAIRPGGNVGIGTTSPLAKLEVKGGGSSITTYDFRVVNTAGETGLLVYEDRSVQIGRLFGSSTMHACFDRTVDYTFAACSSAAEYVPSIDGGFGFPETADLVSIAPTVSNPYGDTHAPFIVQKSSTACDPNLLGFIVNPELGADGEKKNEHYLPLAIYGYFPAKVTLENGVIHRGDALTSSSKPGYAMKATSACKIIGYALEDANQEGTIQVFAEHGESAIAEVVALRAQVDDLKKQMNALDARLDAIEAGQAPLQSGLPPRDVLLWGGLAVAGIMVGRRWQR